MSNNNKVKQGQGRRKTYVETLIQDYTDRVNDSAVEQLKCDMEYRNKWREQVGESSLMQVARSS